MAHLRLSPETILDSLSALPAFPRVVSQVLATLDDDNSSMTMLVNHLQHDPVIAGRVLAAANASSEHGHHALGGVAAAASFIGMRRIREIVLTTSLLDLSRNARSSLLFRKHCLAVGIGAQELAKEFDMNQDYALVAGLLHDIGKLWMSYLHPQENRHVHEQLAEQPRPLCEVERQIFGLDHCAIGEIIARHWGLPEEIIEAIAVHHHPDKPDLGRLAAVIHVSEAICNGLDLPYRDDNQVIEISDQAIQIMGLDWKSDVSDLLGRMSARFQHGRLLLQN